MAKAETMTGNLNLGRALLGLATGLLACLQQWLQSTVLRGTSWDAATGAQQGTGEDFFPLPLTCWGECPSEECWSLLFLAPSAKQGRPCHW
jgi:hypothetical protein